MKLLNNVTLHTLFHILRKNANFQPHRRKQERRSCKRLFHTGGPGENRTPDSAMRMLRNTTLLQALLT